MSISALQCCRGIKLGTGPCAKKVNSRGGLTLAL
jgi:hypothetical protein